MKVQELVAKYKENERINIAKEIETIPYIGIMQKRQLAELVLDNCTYAVDGEVYIDSVERYLLFTISVIGAHTNLEFDYENNMAIEDYDALCESGLLIKVIDTFKDDYASCQEILNMMTTDKLQDNLTIEKILYQFLDGIKGSLDDVLNSLIEQLDFDLLNDLNINKDTLSRLSDLLDNK